MCRLPWKSGGLSLQEHSGPAQACTGIALPLPSHFHLAEGTSAPITATPAVSESKHTSCFYLMFSRTDSNGCPVSIPVSHVSCRSFIKHVQRGIYSPCYTWWVPLQIRTASSPSADSLPFMVYHAPYKTPNNLHNYCGVLLFLVVVVLVLSLSSSLSSPLCRVFILIFLRQTMSLGNTVLQLFCCFYSWRLYS